MRRSLLVSAVLGVGVLVPLALVAQTDSPKEVDESAHRIGFKTVADALETLEAKPGVKISITQPDSWTIISEPGGMVIWSFVPASHAAYPAVVRRAIVVGADKMVRIETAGLCQAAKEPCDKLMNDFKELNEKATRQIQERTKNQGSGKQK